ncbi:MAG TPA: FAD-dependent oxidoreductase [Opitutaceae bacterium]|nr:FAD-dependent oxidoreductase [Opitutaceae bacterium]
MDYEVLIAGGGFAGAYAARQLGKALGRDAERKVALVAERNVMVFQPMLPEVVGSSLGPMDVVVPLRQFCRHASVLQGMIQRIVWEEKKVYVDGGRFTRDHAIGFKHLVVALGSVADLDAVPGMAEYGWPMKEVSHALRLRAGLINRLEEANLVDDAAVRRRLLTFVIVGGGYTGVETAGQIADFVREAHGFFSHLRREKPRVVLIHAGEHLLPEIGVKLGQYAEEVLRERGVEVILKSHVSAITATRVFCREGREVEANTVVTTIGNSPHPVVSDLCRQLGLSTLKGRIRTDEHLRVPGAERLWALGDCAAVPWDDRGEQKTAPPTAQFALQQGVTAGRNLAAALRGGKLRPFRYTYRGQLATIGERAAVAEIFGLHFRGLFAWWLWRTIYLAKLPNALRRLRVTIDWTFDLLFRRDISVLLPRPDEALRNIHLEPGELLFSRGEPCRSFFYVRRGALAAKVGGGPARGLPAGSVIDQALASEEAWEATVAATEPSDVVVFRGPAFQLLRQDLKLVPREKKAKEAGA